MSKATLTAHFIRLKTTVHISFRVISISALVWFTQSPVYAQKSGLLQTDKSAYVKMRNVNIGDVKWKGGFWGDRVTQCEQTMIPYMREIYMEKALKNFKIAAGMEKGGFWGSWWHDGDFYKWVEALVMSYENTKDKPTLKQIDEIISIIAKAQDKDGYINTAIQIGHGTLVAEFTKERSYSEAKRWNSYKEHEIYNLGHLFTLGALHYRVTGETTLLNVANKAADYLYTLFKSTTPEMASASAIFNPPQIMGLIELYRTTGDKKYLELSNLFLDLKGKVNNKSYETQDHLPVLQANEAIGHAVTGLYLYSGMADVYAETGEPAIMNVLNKLWEDITYKKMYVTGGVGSYHNHLFNKEPLHEAFGESYDLPNATAYNETCANISNAMFNWRMLSLTGDSRQADIMEQVFYNSMLSTIGLEGKSYFYTNPLEWHGKKHKLMSNDALKRWNLPRGGICCPTSTIRTIQEISNYAYSINDKTVWVNLYGSNTLNTKLPDGTSVNFTQTTNYPWEENVKLTCNESGKNNYSLMLRIPEWAKGAVVKVNGKAASEAINNGMYFTLNRKWNKGDVVELRLPMAVEMLEANPMVKENINKTAFKRGPVVYCLESQDLNKDERLKNIVIPVTANFKPVYKKDLLGGVTVLQGKALNNVKTPWDNRLYKKIELSKPQETTIQLVPYYAWNNRGIGEMAVWLPLVK